MSDIRSLVENFTNQLAALVESQALTQARAAIEAGLGGRGPGRPAKTSLPAFGKKTRKKPPKQFCPVPGCKNVAAPVFGMVCADHKDVAKAKIKKYREARKAKKLGLKPTKTLKRAKRKTAAKRRKVAKAAKVTKRRTKKVARPVPVVVRAVAAAA